MATEQLLKSREIADIYNVSLGTVNRWVRENKLKAIKTPGGRARFHRSDVDRLLGLAPASDHAVAPEGAS